MKRLRLVMDISSWLLTWCNLALGTETWTLGFKLGGSFIQVQMGLSNGRVKLKARAEVELEMYKLDTSTEDGLLYGISRRSELEWFRQLIQRFDRQGPKLFSRQHFYRYIHSTIHSLENKNDPTKTEEYQIWNVKVQVC